MTAKLQSLITKYDKEKEAIAKKHPEVETESLDTKLGKVYLQRTNILYEIETLREEKSSLPAFLKSHSEKMAIDKIKQLTEEIENLNTEEKRLNDAINAKKQAQEETVRSNKKELIQKIQTALHIITIYLDLISKFNRYGKIRANELKCAILECYKLNDINKVLNDFITTGKTKSDKNASSFFRSSKRCSGTGNSSLRGMLILNKKNLSL